MTTMGPLPAAPAAPTLVCPDCGLGIDGHPATCPRCRGPLPPPGGSAWREGARIMAFRDAVLPDRCVRCGEPGDGRPLRHRMHWHHPALYVLVLFWVIPYVLVALCVRKGATLTISVCAHHRAVRAWSLWGGWGIAALAVVLAGVATARDSAPLWFLALGLVVVALVVGFTGRRLIIPRRIDERIVHATGASPAFLAYLPDWRVPAVRHAAATAAPPPPPPPPAAPDHATADPAAIVAILERGWPELRADPARAAEFAWALEGLHPGVIEGAVHSFSAEGRPLPSPAMLRMAVQARSRAELAPPPPPPPPPPTAWRPVYLDEAPLGDRLRPALVASFALVAAFTAWAGSGGTWARVDSYRSVEVPATDIGGGPIAVWAGLGAIIAGLVACFLVYRREARGLRIAFAAVAALAALVVIGALRGMNRVGVLADQAAAAAEANGFRELGIPQPEVSVTPDLWTTLIAGLVTLALAIGGCLLAHHRERAHAARLAARPRS